MKHLRLLPVCLTVMVVFLAIQILSAQNSMAYSAPKIGFSALGKKDDPVAFKDRLWYGGGLSLGFSGSGNSSVFGFGISPMVGYKIIEQISVGPRVSALYTYQKYTGLASFNLFDLELSMFARFRVYQGFFIQGELGYISDQYIFLDNSQPGGLGKDTRTRTAEYLGIGYNFANGQGGWGQEIAIMYDFFIGNDINAYENPWQYRLVFTYGF